MLSEATITVAAPVSLADYTQPALIMPRLGQQPELPGQLRTAEGVEAILAVLDKITMRQG